jgi:GT2 family glycosyltransferase/spore maturation protein CgeB
MQSEDATPATGDQGGPETSALFEHLEQLHAHTGELEQRMAGLQNDAVPDVDGADHARLVSELRASRNELAGLRKRKSVRVALRFAEVAYPLARRFRRVRLPKLPARLRATRMEAALRKARPDQGPAGGALISMIVVTRDGGDHLERLLDGLENRTAYRDFELIVVDNDSTDHTQSLLDRSWSFPVNIIHNASNRTYSEANNQGLAAAGGDYILLLNNDVSPINPGWLGALVKATTEGDNVVGAGALLVYPAQTGNEGAKPLTVQHRGIAFSWRDRAPRPVNLGSGEDPTSGKCQAVVPVPAVTGACALFARAALEAVGGLTEGYVYGWEDVDLSMKLRRAGGELVFCGQAALYHYEFGTQSKLGAERRRINYLGNSRRFLETWQPYLRRALVTDQLAGAGFWAVDGVRKLAITVTDEDQTAGFGDWYTAHELGDQLTALGWNVAYAPRKRDAWYEIAPDTDVVINLLPQFDVTQAPEGAFTVAWVRNWVDRWLENPSFRYYDLAVASTGKFAAAIDRTSEVDVSVLPLATNPERFQPGETDVALTADYTFTGSFWGKGRELERFLDVRPGETFTIFGKGWDRRPRGQRYWRGHLEYDRLPALYSSVTLVLDDTVEPNLPAVNSRVFDALAAGTLVLSDNPAGSEEWFDGLLPTYTNRIELRDQLDRYLADDDLRAETVDKLRALVLERHTYKQRARQFTEAISASLNKPRVAIRIGPPGWDVADSWGDTHFARHFARALRKQGFATDITIVPEWDSLRHQHADVVLHLRGLTPYAVKPGNLNVLWIISHPDDITPEECNRYDLVFVASKSHASDLAGRVSVPVHSLLQATDTSIFKPTPAREDLRCDAVFVGNSRGRRRPSVDWAIEAGLNLAVYGSDWHGLIPERFIKGPYFPNDQLAELYASAKIVLNDHWSDMRSRGFISNRVFDVLASGGVLLTDDVTGMSSVLGDGVIAYSDRAVFQRELDRLLGDDEARHRLSETGPELAARHSFQARATEFARLVAPVLDTRSNSTVTWSSNG